MKKQTSNKNKTTNQNDFNTRVINTKEVNKKANSNKSKTKSKKDSSKNKNSKKAKIIKKLLIVFLILMIIGAGIFAGVIFGLFGDKFAITRDDMIIKYVNSVVVDTDGEVIATLSGKENREILTKQEMGDYLPKAFVSIEDERFYKHHGVDIKRTTAAIATFLFHKGESSFGGSTITQQLVKNITNEKEDSGTAGAIRKIKEMVRAYQVENILSKDQILELYMNIIFLGGNVNGVGMASRYYFSKDAADLSLAESAYIAGVTHSPNYYKPFDEKPNTEKINARTKTVLKKMKETGNITEEEYNEAVEEVEKGLNFKQGKINQASYSSHTEALINQILDQLVTDKGMDREYAKTYLYSGGFTIHSTEKSSIQKVLEEEYSKKTYQVKSKVTKDDNGKYVNSQSATVVIDHKTGNVVGCVGVLGEKEAFELNRATQSPRQPGSSIKPIGVYGPALEEKVITAASVYDDVPISYGSWSPGNAYSGYKGLSNMRQAIRISQNTIAVQVLEKLTASKSIGYLKKMGVTTLNDTSDNNLSLALGGISKGITPLQMAGAYATIANDGEYITPTFYTKMEDSSGKTILEPKQNKERVFSEQNAFIMKELLIEPTQSGGTATNCKISGMDTAAKTGTTNSKKDKWLCGFTPYYTAATWFGYDQPERVYTDTYASVIWKNVMSGIHKGLDNASFKEPNGLVKVAVCKDSGMLASDLCKKDPRGSRVYTEYFVKGTEPKKSCTCHVSADICEDSKNIANNHCPNKKSQVFITRGSESKNWKSAADAKYMLPDKECTTHKDGDNNNNNNDNKDKKESVPKITLNGSSTITLKVGETYTEQGAKASDETDGDLTSKIEISGKVDTSKAGNYTITYTVKNSQDKSAKVTRKVTVSEKESKPENKTEENETT